MPVPPSATPPVAQSPKPATGPATPPAIDPTIDPMTQRPAPADYTSEIRFGIVMYGGVSLAIYINGVTNEVFEMACATPRDGVVIDRAGEPFTRDIYRRLSWLVGNDAVRARYATAIRRARDEATGAIRSTCGAR